MQQCNRHLGRLCFSVFFATSVALAAPIAMRSQAGLEFAMAGGQSITAAQLDTEFRCPIACIPGFREPPLIPASAETTRIVRAHVAAARSASGRVTFSAYGRGATPARLNIEISHARIAIAKGGAGACVRAFRDLRGIIVNPRTIAPEVLHSIGKTLRPDLFSSVLVEYRPSAYTCLQEPVPGLPHTDELYFRSSSEALDFFDTLLAGFMSWHKRSPNGCRTDINPQSSWPPSADYRQKSNVSQTIGMGLCRGA